MRKKGKNRYKFIKNKNEKITPKEKKRKRKKWTSGGKKKDQIANNQG